MVCTETVLIITWAVFQLFLGFWMSRGGPSKSVRDRYTKVVLIQSAIPFMTSWRAKIRLEDIHLFEEFRRRFFVFYATLLLFSVSFRIYFYIKYMHLL